MKKVCRQNFPLDNLASMCYNDYRKKKGMTTMRKEFFCPVDDWDCPYCEKDGLCALGASASKECDEAAAAFFCEGEEEGEEC